MKRNTRAGSAVINQTLVDEIKDLSPEMQSSLAIFCDTISGPVDRACELLVLKGADAAFNAALGLLVEPNPRSRDVQTQIHNLALACQDWYAARGLTDDFDKHKRGLRAYPVWESLANAAIPAPTECGAVRAAQGVILGLAWVGLKKMAPGYMGRISKSVPTCLGGVDDLLEELNTPKSERTIDTLWLFQFKQFLENFREAFDAQPHANLPEKSFTEKARSEWKARAAFTSYRRRAAVLDKTCLSERQIDAACKFQGTAGFSSLQEKRVAMWLIGFSGLNTQTCHRIPIHASSANTLDEDWVARYDAANRLLLRDFSDLAADAASASGRLAEPAGYILPCPAPTLIANDIDDLLKENPAAQTSGDLIPHLKQLVPDWPLIPATDSLTPSWAKWSKTLGPWLRKLGMDNLLAALLTGDFGMMAKSKGYYCHVKSSEIWRAAGFAYAALGWGEAVPEPLTILPFGASVV